MRALLALLTASAAVGVSACASEPDDAGAREAPVTQVAYEYCSRHVETDEALGVPPAAEFLTLADGGHTTTLATPGTGYVLESLDLMNCLLDKTGAPDSVVSKARETSAPMGRQTASWDGVEVSWTFSPRNAFVAVFKDRSLRTS